MVAVPAGSDRAGIEGFEFRVLDLVTAQGDPHQRQRPTGEQGECVGVLVEQILTGGGSGAAEHHRRAESGVPADLPGGPGVRAVLGEVADGLHRGAGRGGRCAPVDTDGTIQLVAAIVRGNPDAPVDAADIPGRGTALLSSSETLGVVGGCGDAWGCLC